MIETQQTYLKVNGVQVAYATCVVLYLYTSIILSKNDSWDFAKHIYQNVSDNEKLDIPFINV